MRIAWPSHACLVVSAVVLAQLISLKSLASPLVLGGLIDTVHKSLTESSRTSDISLSAAANSNWTDIQVSAYETGSVGEETLFESVHGALLSALASFGWPAHRDTAGGFKGPLAPPAGSLGQGLLLLVLVEASGALLRGLHEVIAARLGDSVTRAARRRFMRRLLQQEASFFEGTHTAVLAQAYDKLGLVFVMVAQLLPDALRNVLQVVVAGVFLLRASPATGFALLALLPAVAVVERICDQLVNEARRQLYELERRQAKHRGESLRAAGAIKAWSWEGRRCDEYDALLDEDQGVRAWLTTVKGLRGGVNALTLAVASTLTWYVGLQEVASGARTLGELSATAVIVERLRTGLATALKQTRQFFEHTRDLDLAFRLMDRRSQMPPGEEASPAGSEAPATGRRPVRLEFQGVHFSYPAPALTACPTPGSGGERHSAPKGSPGLSKGGEALSRAQDEPPSDEGQPQAGLEKQPHEVLQGLDLVLEAGKVTALVGASGAGKSTVAALALRLHDPTRGRVLLDGGVDLRAVAPSAYHLRTAVVSQTPLLFSCSIRENIEFGCRRRRGARAGKGCQEAIGGFSKAEVEAAARLARAHEFIESKEGGYEAPVGERGVRLSGGERQRLALARALLADPDLLVLDEATSALDAESEAQVARALETAMRGRTVLVIAHRLSTIRGADRIVVLRGGTVAEQGTHAELMRKVGGAYRTLVDKQTGDDNT